jgi:hypothetical protein
MDIEFKVAILRLRTFLCLIMFLRDEEGSEVSIDVMQWKGLIEGLLFRISDEKYQRWNWFNQPSEESSPDELISQLYHDYNFQLFVNDPNVGLTSSQREAAQAFLNKVSEFCDQTSPVRDPHTTMDDPKWDAIRRAAKSLSLILFPERSAADVKMLPSE